MTSSHPCPPTGDCGAFPLEHFGNVWRDRPRHSYLAASSPCTSCTLIMLRSFPIDTVHSTLASALQGLCPCRSTLHTAHHKSVFSVYRSLSYTSRWSSQSPPPSVCWSYAAEHGRSTECQWVVQSSLWLRWQRFSLLPGKRTSSPPSQTEAVLFGTQVKQDEFQTSGVIDV